MKANNKSILIGGLLAIVLIMAVGYAAFATSLSITGTSKIDSTWNVAFDTTVTTGTATGTATCGTVTYSNNNATATISQTTLKKPTDQCVYNLKVQNLGTLNASVAAAAISECKSTETGSTAWTIDSTKKTCTSTSGNTQFIVTSTATTLNAKSGNTISSADVVVTVKFVDKTVVKSASEAGQVKIGFQATQAA